MWLCERLRERKKGGGEEKKGRRKKRVNKQENSWKYQTTSSLFSQKVTNTHQHSDENFEHIIYIYINTYNNSKKK